MSLNEYSDRELRKWCVEKTVPLGFGVAERIVADAETLFQYIKYGPDDGCDCCDEPDGHGPINTGPGMNVLRSCASLEIAEQPVHIPPE